MKKKFIGILLSAAMVVATIVNPMVTAATDAVAAQEIESFRKADGNHTAPTKIGYVFAGWYTDDTYAEPIPEDQLAGLAVPKWVDANVLTAKWQIGATTTAGDSLTKLRVVTTVDSKAYQEVGFVINNGTVDSVPVMSKNVYKTISGTVNGTPTTYEPQTAFCASSQFFMIREVGNIPSEFFPAIMTVTPQWKTLDGTVVKGTATAFRIKEALESLTRKATITTNLTEVDRLASLADGNFNNGTWTGSQYITGDDQYTFNWANPVSFNKLVMTVSAGYKQGPTNWKIEVSKDGQSNWETVDTITSAWTQSGAVREEQELTFGLQANIKGLRITVIAAHTDWNGYSIFEIEAYNDQTLYDTNYAQTATVSANTQYALTALTDGNYLNNTWRDVSTTSSGVTEFKDNAEYISFKWNSSVSVNKVVMFGYKGMACAPTAWRVGVLKDGETNWTEVATATCTWTLGGDQGSKYETYELSFATQENIKELRIWIDKVNNAWGSGYGIGEIEIYHDLDFNYAFDSTITTSGVQVDRTNVLNDGIKPTDGSNNAWWNGLVTEPNKHYLQFDWANMISVNKVVMYVTSARNAAPTAWHVEVLKGGVWTKVASTSGLTWANNNGGLESSELTFATEENIKSLRLYVDEKTTGWNGCSFVEVEIYNDVFVN